MKKFFVTILKYLALIIGVLSCLMSFIVLPVTLVFLPLGIFLIFMGLKPVEYLDGTIAKRKKEEKTWFNYLFDSCCACCSWRVGSILPVYEETAVAGYRAYTDDGDGKTGCKRYGCRISGNSERGY